MDPRNLENARDFLKLRRVAFVGLSRDGKDFSRYLFRELAKRGLDVVPVHPGMTEAEGRPCFGRLQEVTPPVEGAFVMTHPQHADRILGDCVAAGVQLGASPRGSIALDRCARAHAWLAGRDFVSPEDIQTVLFDVLRHRLILSFEAEAAGVDQDRVIQRILDVVAVA